MDEREEDRVDACIAGELHLKNAPVTSPGDGAPRSFEFRQKHLIKAWFSCGIDVQTGEGALGRGPPARRRERRVERIALYRGIQERDDQEIHS